MKTDNEIMECYIKEEFNNLNTYERLRLCDILIKDKENIKRRSLENGNTTNNK